jgi:hypothetical protein
MPTVLQIDVVGSYPLLRRLADDADDADAEVVLWMKEEKEERDCATDDRRHRRRCSDNRGWTTRAWVGERPIQW